MKINIQNRLSEYTIKIKKYSTKKNIPVNNKNQYLVYCWFSALSDMLQRWERDVVFILIALLCRAAAATTLVFSRMMLDVLPGKKKKSSSKQ